MVLVVLSRVDDLAPSHHRYLIKSFLILSTITWRLRPLGHPLSFGVFERQTHTNLDLSNFPSLQSSHIPTDLAAPITTPVVSRTITGAGANRT